MAPGTRAPIVRAAVSAATDDGGNDLDLISRAEAAALLHVTPRTLSRWSTHGLLPHVRLLGGERRYPREVILQLAREQEAPLTQVRSA